MLPSRRSSLKSQLNVASLNVESTVAQIEENIQKQNLETEPTVKGNALSRTERRLLDRQTKRADAACMPLVEEFFDYCAVEKDNDSRRDKLLTLDDKWCTFVKIHKKVFGSEEGQWDGYFMQRIKYTQSLIKKGIK
jgi:hypothetical protein